MLLSFQTCSQHFRKEKSNGLKTGDFIDLFHSINISGKLLFYHFCLDEYCDEELLLLLLLLVETVLRQTYTSESLFILC